MNMEQKLAYLQKALEMGADIQLNFHFISNKKEAEKMATVLSEISGTPAQEDSYESTRWLKIKDESRVNPIDASFFYKYECMVEDVNLTGDENVAI